MSGSAGGAALRCQPSTALVEQTVIPAKAGIQTAPPRASPAPTTPGEQAGRLPHAAHRLRCPSSGRSSAWFRALRSGRRGRKFKSSRPDSPKANRAGEGRKEKVEQAVTLSPRRNANTVNWPSPAVSFLLPPLFATTRPMAFRIHRCSKRPKSSGPGAWRRSNLSGNRLTCCARPKRGCSPHERA